MKDFAQLVHIKVLREGKAERAMLAQQRRLKQAHLERDEAHRQLEDFRVHAQQEERRLYGRLCEKPVRLRDIELTRDEMLLLKEREHTHVGELQDAERRRERERQQLDEDRHAYELARRKRSKFDEIAEVLAEERRMEAERREDTETEEVAQNRRPKEPAA